MGIFREIIVVSIYGGLLIILTLALRFFCSRFLAREFIVFLWEIAIVRFLLPDVVYAKFSIFGRVVSSAVESGAFRQSHMMSWKLLDIIWLSGMILLGAFFVITYMRKLKLLKQAVAVDETIVEKWKMKRREAEEISVKECKNINVPLSYGVFKPVILLPVYEEEINVENFFCVMEHEYQHIKHRDLLKKYIMIIVLCIHWFNPLVWVMYTYFNRDLELLCDKRVVGSLGNERRKGYASMLVDLCSVGVRKNLFPELGNGKLKERIEYIVKPESKSRLQIPLIIAGIALVTMCFFGREYEEKEEIISETFSGAAEEEIISEEEKAEEKTEVEKNNIKQSNRYYFN